MIQFRHARPFEHLNPKVFARLRYGSAPGRSNSAAVFELPVLWLDIFSACALLFIVESLMFNVALPGAAYLTWKTSNTKP
jgi:hypothetical protein